MKDRALRQLTFGAALLGSVCLSAAITAGVHTLSSASARARRAALFAAVRRGDAVGRWSLRGFDLRRAKFGGITFRATDLRGADLRLSDLRGARFWSADLRGA